MKAYPFLLLVCLVLSLILSSVSSVSCLSLDKSCVVSLAEKGMVHMKAFLLVATASIVQGISPQTVEFACLLRSSCNRSKEGDDLRLVNIFLAFCLN